jgi:glycerol kinase
MYAAGLAVGVWASLEEVEEDWPGTECGFKPHMAPKIKKDLLDNWHKAIDKSLGWAPSTL